MRSRRLALTLALAAVAAPLAAQDAGTLDAVVRDSVLEVGASTTISFAATWADGTTLGDAGPVALAFPRGAFEWEDGTLTARVSGEYGIVATLSRPDRATLATRFRITVLPPPVTSIEIAPVDPDVTLYTSTQRFFEATAIQGDGVPRPGTTFTWATADPSIATVDALGRVRGIRPGSTELRARAEGVSASVPITVAALPEGTLTLERAAHEGPIRTGDVLTFDAAYAAGGAPIADVPVVWTATRVAEPFEYAGAPAGAQIREGKFVADVPGTYQVVATVGNRAVDDVFEVAPRDVVEEVEVTGHALNAGYRVTDLWVFEGVDGRDYAMTGSKVADGHAYFYDVTDPTNLIKYDSIQVNGRTVNDVKVSPDGRYGVISREGASDRRNGVVIVDLQNPREPKVASIYDEGLTGGVHNIFATDTHLFALSAGDKYVILDMSDIYAPRFVSEYNHPDSRLHDVWVHDGLAYSSEWGNGVVVVDVGNGRWGGTIENPVFVTNYVLPTGRTHAAFPYYSESAGRMYIFTGDEIMNRSGKAWAGYPRSMGSYSSRYDPDTGTGGIPLTTSGYIQIIDFTDPENPEMVARYEVPEFGTHNMWIEDDRLYQAYYEGGVRVVDVSGELMGNLYDQGREIAVFKSASPAGYTPNATMVWGAQPHKGHVFFSDTNSGLWSVRLVPRTRPVM
jgi:hypothetical protein